VFDKDVEVSNYTTIDEDIFTELNELRTNPRSFIPILEDLKQYFDTTGFIFKFPGKFAKTTTDGVAAIDEAIAYLETVPEATRLRRLQDEWKTNLIVTDAMDNPESLILACEDYVKDVGPTGVTTKTGVDGSSIQDRIERHGIWTSTFA
jgi:hypothetical protein